MSLFQQVTLTWNDSSYVIPADRVLGAIATAEEFLTLHELEQFQKRGTVPMVRLAQAYGAVLRYAGCSAGNDDVYFKMMQGKLNAGLVVTGLLMMMVPPGLSDEAPASGNVSRAEGKSSKKRTKLPSAD